MCAAHMVKLTKCTIIYWVYIGKMSSHYALYGTIAFGHIPVNIKPLAE